MFLVCLSTCSSNDKIAFDVGVQESNNGEASWWTIHPASKQRSEGEKVRVGDDVILVSVATERYLVSFVNLVIWEQDILLPGRFTPCEFSDTIS
jgi:ryanodine receptor 2